MTTAPIELTLAEALQRALAMHRAGDLAEADALYRAVLNADNRQLDAVRLLGILEMQRGRLAEADQCFVHALRLDPSSAEALAGRADLLKRMSRFDEALAHCERALLLRPAVPETLNIHGALLLDLRRFDEAVISCSRALALRAAFPEALYNRGLALQSLERFEEALASYDEAVRIKPDFAEAFQNRGTVLKDLGRHDESLASWNRAIAIRPDFSVAYNNRGLALHLLGRVEEALASYDIALQIHPQFAEALNNRGAALKDLKRHAEALESCELALAYKPDFAEAFNVCGTILSRLKRYTDAVDAYGRALKINPDLAEALHNRALALQQLQRHDEASGDFARALASNPRLPYCRSGLLFSRMHCCDWQGNDEMAQLVVSDVLAGARASEPFPLLGMTDDPAVQLRGAQAWVVHRCLDAPSASWRGERYRHERIRVAYLSADFHRHATSFLMAGLFEQHDRSRFETIAVSFGPRLQDAMSVRLANAFERFFDVQGTSDRAVATLMRELEVDIAVDLKGYTYDARAEIFTMRPAPVQVSYLGYPGTMAAPCIDYIIADEIVIPEAHRSHFTEQVVYLPDSYQVNDDARVIADGTPGRAACGLPEEGFVFCCFNNSYKITPRMFDIWMRLLSAVDGSVLWLLEANAVAPGRLRREAQARGVAPERLVFAPKCELSVHLARHRCADLFLDTLPVNAHTTASDALWAGLPVLTSLGRSFAGRVAASLLRAVGLSELITSSLGEYERRALELARDSTQLVSLRQRLVKNRDSAPLFDTDRFRRHLEMAYEEMWRRQQRGEAPAAFAVAPIA